MITNIDAANDAFNAAESDASADLNAGRIGGIDEPLEVEWHDLVVSVAYDCDAPTALELCRTKLGHVPHELKYWLGDIDWVQ